MKWISRLFRKADERTATSHRSRPVDLSDLLPKFRYHPNPVATGSVRASDAICPCCDRERGCEYVASVFSAERVKGLCPWCIADGSAAQKFDATFVDDYPLLDKGVPKQIVEVVTKRTPGYSSWNEATWRSCCDDACAFHGDIDPDELRSLPASVIKRARKDYPIPQEIFDEMLAEYVPGGSFCIFKFVCLHCGQIQLAIDND